jgi:hypothetical protein
MKKRDIASVLVWHVGEVIGIVSKTDIHCELVSQTRNGRQGQGQENNDKPSSGSGPA